MTAQARAAGAAVAQQAVCEIPGCGRGMEYRGSGRPPKYCGAVVDGVPHNRLTAFRIANGQIAWPLGQPADGDADEDGRDPSGRPRPVSVARMTVQTLLEEFHALAAGHESRITALTDRIKAAVATAGDPDAAAAEVTAAHREARALVDAAETDRDAARARVRAAERDIDVAAAAQRVAEEAAEQALAELEDAQEARAGIERARVEQQTRAEQLGRDIAEITGERDGLTTEVAAAGAERDRVATELIAAGVERDRLATELAAARAENATLTAEREHLTREVAEARTAVDALRRRAERSERDLVRTEAATGLARDRLQEASSTLAEVTSRAEQQSAQLAAVREQLAQTRGQLDGAQAAVAAEKAHSARRLADQREFYGQQLLLLRTRLEDIDRTPGDDSDSAYGGQDVDALSTMGTTRRRSRGSGGRPRADDEL